MEHANLEKIVCTRISAFVQHGSNPLPHLWDSPPNHHLPRIAKNGEEKEKHMVNAPHVSRVKVYLSGGPERDVMWLAQTSRHVNPKPYDVVPAC